MFYNLKMYKINQVIVDSFVIASMFLILTMGADETINIPGDELDGPNICKRVEDYVVEVVVSEMQPYQER